MPVGGVLTGTADTFWIEAPVTIKIYLIYSFVAFGGIFFGCGTGWMCSQCPTLSNSRQVCNTLQICNQIFQR